MLAADKDVLISNADNHVARQKGVLVLHNGVLMSSKYIYLFTLMGLLGLGQGMLILVKATIPPYNGILMPNNKQCVGKAKECWSEARACG